jgi:hypothetical protein
MSHNLHRRTDKACIGGVGEKVGQWCRLRAMFDAFYYAKGVAGLCSAPYLISNRFIQKGPQQWQRLPTSNIAEKNIL